MIVASVPSEVETEFRDYCNGRKLRYTDVITRLIREMLAKEVKKDADSDRVSA